MKLLDTRIAFPEFRQLEGHIFQGYQLLFLRPDSNSFRPQIYGLIQSCKLTEQLITNVHLHFNSPPSRAFIESDMTLSQYVPSDVFDLCFSLFLDVFAY